MGSPGGDDGVTVAIELGRVAVGVRLSVGELSWSHDEVIAVDPAGADVDDLADALDDALDLAAAALWGSARVAVHRRKGRAVRLEVQNWRWGRTPFFLRAGKRMPRRATEIAVHFQHPPHPLFPRRQDGAPPLGRNVLLLRVQPDEGVSLRFGSKVPGPAIKLRDVRMDFRYGSSFGGRSPDAYERLLLDAMVGDSTLFARRDEVEEAWRIVDSIAAGWAEGGGAPHSYEAGTWGPAEARALLGEDRTWRKP